MVFQISAALLDACVLSVVRNGDSYGYSLTQNLKEIIVISGSTLYPVLRRLQADGLLDYYDEPFEGRNRRYYTITAKGRTRLDEYRNEWKKHRSDVDKILMGDETA